ncbi:MAG: dTDP-4-amino-4,6-dideoxyglucose formyltransferase [Chloroflexia bacterium]|nr:dTDP-4-amino-4,6-dideoxyglucose formyltransferase [Chloroflexia bacterium]
MISLHCKQLFPTELVNTIKCINIHPGLNPYNRGWFPQVFSIINKMPLGATIHEIDEELDHGNIIAQQEIVVYPWDTSLTAYNRVLETELILIQDNIISIFENTYSTIAPKKEGNINYKKDFDEICQLDLQEVNELGYFIDKLRALTHGNYPNAYFFDKNIEKKYMYP